MWGSNHLFLRETLWILSSRLTVGCCAWGGGGVLWLDCAPASSTCLAREESKRWPSSSSCGYRLLLLLHPHSWVSLPLPSHHHPLLRWRSPAFSIQVPAPHTPHFAVGRDCLLHVSEPRTLLHHHWENKSVPLLWQNGHLSTIVVLLLSHV